MRIVGSTLHLSITHYFGGSFVKALEKVFIGGQASFWAALSVLLFGKCIVNFLSFWMFVNKES